jgi:hypothetical protein
LYAGAVAAESARAGRHAPMHVAAGMPAVFVTLHASWGAGFLIGSARFGGLRGVLGAQVARVRRALR